jgi:transposase InsO family protein
LIESEIKRLHRLTGIALLTLAVYAGVSKRTFREWQERRETETKHNGHIPREHWLTPDEYKAIISFCENRMENGYRYLCWLMIDANIAYVSPATVYNTLKKAGLTKKWAEMEGEVKKGFDQPKAIHEHWHIDFSYIRVCGVFYYFISVMDGYSRKILAWMLCESMEGMWAEIIIAKTRELYTCANPRIISDNGSQFTSKDFHELTKLLEMKHTFTSPAHPQSNGKLERFHRTLKEEHVRTSAYFSYEDAKERMGRYINYYNVERLHAALLYLPPEDVFQGLKEIRIAERREKLYTAIISRRNYWQSLAVGSEPPYMPSSKTASSA